MSAMSSQITSLAIVYSTFFSGADQRKQQSSASLVFVQGIHRWPVNYSHKGPVTRKIFPFDDVIMHKVCHKTTNILCNPRKYDFTKIHLGSSSSVVKQPHAAACLFMGSIVPFGRTGRFLCNCISFDTTSVPSLWGSKNSSLPFWPICIGLSRVTFWCCPWIIKELYEINIFFKRCFYLK